LKETSESLDSKALTVSELEGQIDELKASLAQASAEIKAKRAAVEELEMAKHTSESELQEAKDALAQLKLESQGGSVILQTVQSEVCLAPFVVIYLLILFILA
jgi:hypothetical protein